MNATEPPAPRRGRGGGTGKGRLPIGPQINFRLTREQLALIDLICAERGITRAQWIRDALELSLAG